MCRPSRVSTRVTLASRPRIEAGCEAVRGKQFYSCVDRCRLALLPNIRAVCLFRSPRSGSWCSVCLAASKFTLRASSPLPTSFLSLSFSLPSFRVLGLSSERSLRSRAYRLRKHCGSTASCELMMGRHPGRRLLFLRYLWIMLWNACSPTRE